MNGNLESRLSECERRIDAYLRRLAELEEQVRQLRASLKQYQGQ
jgi:uncharacterized protein YeeX (DUF496 family)